MSAQFEPYHLIVDWGPEGELSMRLLGSLSIELTPGETESVSNYSVPVALDPEGADRDGLTWLRAKIVAATRARVGSDPVVRPRSERSTPPVPS